MLRLKLQLSDVCLTYIDNLSEKESKTVSADLILRGVPEFLGVLDIGFGPQSDAKDTSSETIPKRKSPKRMQPAVLSKKPIPKNKTMTGTSPVSAENMLSLADNPAAFINVSQNMISGQKSFNCAVCGQTASLDSSIKRHIKEKHMPSSVIFKCQFCEHSCNRKSDLKKHYLRKRHSLTEQQATAMLLA